MSVAESMVIFWPIFHVGCFKAASGVTRPSSSVKDRGTDRPTP